MSAQAFIFDLSAFPHVPSMGKATGLRTDADAPRLLSHAVEHDLPCALISELPYQQAQQQIRERFGEPAHHIFSVVLTGADFEARGHKAPYSVVLDQLGVPPDDVLAVTASPRAIVAARTARIGIETSR